MSQVDVAAIAPGRTAGELYRIIGDFRRYPEQVAAVLSVRIVDGAGDCVVSEWEVQFRRGILRWTEEDTFDDRATTIRFRQLTGDVETFDGSWTLSDSEDGCLVCFTARFDMGIKGLEHIIGPIAEQTLRDNIRAIMLGLIGEPLLFQGELTPSGEQSLVELA